MKVNSTVCIHEKGFIPRFLRTMEICEHSKFIPYFRLIFQEII